MKMEKTLKKRVIGEFLLPPSGFPQAPRIEPVIAYEDGNNYLFKLFKITSQPDQLHQLTLPCNKTHSHQSL